MLCVFVCSRARTCKRELNSVCTDFMRGGCMCFGCVHSTANSTRYWSIESSCAWMNKNHQIKICAQELLSGIEICLLSNPKFLEIWKLVLDTKPSTLFYSFPKKHCVRLQKHWNILFHIFPSPCPTGSIESGHGCMK